VCEAASPCKDGGNRVGRGGATLLVLTPVTSNGTMGSLGLNSLTIGADKHGSHETERAVALSDDIGLDITIVVLASPDETTVGLESLSHHVINKAVLVPDAELLELLLVLLLVDLLEDVLEETVVLLEDGVLRRKVERPLLHESILERRVRESTDGFNGVVHCHAAATLFGVLKDLPLLRSRAISRSEANLEGAGLVSNEVKCLVLVTESMTTDDNGLSPARHETRNVLHNNGLTEDGTTENVTDGTVRREPHLLEIELLDTRFIGSDRGALDTNVVLLDRLSSLDGHAVLGLVTVRQTQVEVLDVNVEVGQHKLLLDVVPDDSGHFIT